ERVQVTGHHGGTRSHGLGQDHPERLATGVRRDIEIDAAQHPGLVLLGHGTEEGDPVADGAGPVGHRLVRIARPGDQQAQTRRAESDTAIRAVIFSSTTWSAPCAAAIARDRVVAVWNVATTGVRA